MTRLPPAALALLFVLLTACGGSLVRSGSRGSPTPEATGSRRIGGGLNLETDAPGTDGSSSTTGASPGTAAKTPSAFTIVIVDQNGGHPAGIPVEITGPKSAVLTSDAQGHVLVEGPPGYYTFKVPVRCGDDVQTRAGGTGRFGIAEGQSGQGEVRVEWQHRFAPTGPVYPSIGPNWPVGEDVRIRFSVYDRCKDSTSPNRGLPTYAVSPGANIRVVTPPAERSDANGYNFVTVRCARAGDAELIIADRTNPSDVLDLAQGASSPQKTRCG